MAERTLKTSEKHPCFTRERLIFAVLIAFLVGLLYFDIIKTLFGIWLTDSDQSHGLLLIAAACYLIYRRRQNFKQIDLQTWIPGFFILFSGILFLLAGQIAVEYFAMRSSLVIIFAGIVGFLWGKNALKLLIFPLLLLLMAIPLPAIVVNTITLPLKSLVSSVAAEMLRILGTSVLQEGNILQTPNITLEIVNACSGIRSFFSLFVMAMLFCSDMKTPFQKAILLGLTIPVSIFSNALRITATGILAIHWDPKTAMGFYHSFSGWVIFLLSLVILLAIKHLINTAPLTGKGKRS